MILKKFNKLIKKMSALNISQEIKDFFQHSHDFPFVKSDDGSTGITLLPLSWKFNWVVKWQNLSLTESEHLSTKFYKKTFKHLSIPKIHLIKNNESIGEIAKLFNYKTDRNGKTITLGTQVPMFIRYEKGSNLGALIKNDFISFLSEEDIKNLFKIFGQIAAYDHLIANFDRFLSFKFNKENIDPNYSINEGNIIIDVPFDDHGNRHLGNVYVIDNSPHKSFLNSSERRKARNCQASDDENSSGFYLSNVFADSEELQEELCDIENLEKKSRSSLNPNMSEETLRESHKEKFRDFMSFQEEDLYLLAQQICVGIRNLKKDADKKTAPFLEKLSDDSLTLSQIVTQSLFKGLLEGQKNIRSIDTDKTVSYLNEIRVETEAGKIIQEFIIQNLMYINELNKSS